MNPTAPVSAPGHAKEDTMNTYSNQTVVWLVSEGEAHEGQNARSVHISRDGALEAAAVLRKRAGGVWELLRVEDTYTIWGCSADLVTVEVMPLKG